MAIDPEARRAEGVSPLPASATQGSRGKGNDSGDAVNLPTTGLDVQLHAPGGHVNRGVEANTNLFGSEGEPMVDTNVAGERPQSVTSAATVAAFGGGRLLPDSSGLIATSGDSDGHPWEGADSTAKNSMPLNIPHDAFSAVGEHPYTKDQQDGRT